MWPNVRSSVRTNDNQCEMAFFSLSGSLQPTFNLMIDVHVMVIWQLSERGICWPVAHDRAAGSSFNLFRSFTFLRFSADQLLTFLKLIADSS